MPQATAIAPISIRLAYRYPNGCLLTYGARAIARTEKSVRVIVNEEFEEGMTLSVMAPFLDGLTTTRVHSVKRSRKNPGYFEVVLRLDAEGDAGLGSDEGGEGLAASDITATDLADTELAPTKRAIVVDSGPKVTLFRSPVPSAEPEVDAAVPDQAVPDQAIDAAEKLAYELSKLPARNLSKVIQEIPSEMRGLSLLISIAAALHILQEKKFADTSRLIAGLRSTAKETARQ